MRLEDDVNLAESALLRRSERHLDLGGLVFVVSDHADARRAAAQLKAPVDPTELIERSPDCIHADVEPDSNSDRCRRIEHVVYAGHVQRELAKVLLLISNVKATVRS